MLSTRAALSLRIISNIEWGFDYKILVVREDYLIYFVEMVTRGMNNLVSLESTYSAILVRSS